MPRKILLTALATLAALTVGAAKSEAAAGNPCTIANTTVLWDPAVGERGNQGEATGVQKIDGVWTFLRCEMTLDPATWAKDTPAQRCTVVAHELVHLIRGDGEHAPSGLMALVPGYYAPCHSLRERVKHDLLAGLPTGAGAICGKGSPVFYCRTFTTGADGWQRERRYRVRTHGGSYSILRVPLPR